MNFILNIIFVIVIFNSLLFLSSKRNIMANLVFALVILVFSYFTFNIALTSGKTSFVDIISIKGGFPDFSLLCIIEALWGILISFLSVNSIMGKKYKLFNIYQWFPGLLIPIAVLWFQIQLLLIFPGYNFDLMHVMSLIMVAIMFIIIPYMLSKILMSREFAFELIFILNIFMIISALSMTILSMNVQWPETEFEYNLTALSVFLLVMCFLSSFGYILNRIKTIKQNKKWNS